MGSSISAHRNSSYYSVMKLRLSFGSKSDNNLVIIPPLPIKDKPSQLPNIGSKEESFFDSRPYLESDCEDDFFSVNGDFTPSRGNTPVHHKFSNGTPRLNKVALEDQTPDSTLDPSPTSKKKKLLELFRDSIREDQDVVDDQTTQNNKNLINGNMKVVPTILDLPSKSPYSRTTSYVSGTNSVCSSERTANGITGREKSLRSMQCCLPGFISGRFSDRKKMVPAGTVNDEP